MKILSFDVESNGLHGDAFAVAGVLVGADGAVDRQIVLRSPIVGPLDPWVNDNVLGPMEHIPQTHDTAAGMRAAFWNWFVRAKAEAFIAVCANPYPVEARFLIQCQEDDLPARELDHPFPLYDLSSMLITLGYPERADRRRFIKQYVQAPAGEAHDPLWDTTVTAQAAVAALEVTRQNGQKN